MVAIKASIGINFITVERSRRKKNYPLQCIQYVHPKPMATCNPEKGLRLTERTDFHTTREMTQVTLVLITHQWGRVLKPAQAVGDQRRC